MRKPVTRRARLVRKFALDRNELRRRSDRVEAWFLLALMITFVPLAVVAAISAARWVRIDGADHLAGGLRLGQATAVLERAAPAEATIPFGSMLVSVPARWTIGGVRHTGDIPASPGTPARASIRISVDAAGKVAQPPLTSSELSAREVLAAGAAPLAVAFGMLLAWCGLRWLLDRRRLAAWDESWSIVGPSWMR
jgi:hypothetical protein